MSIAGYMGWPAYDTFLIVSLTGWPVYDPNPLRPNPNPKKPVSGLCRVCGLGQTLTPLLLVLFFSYSLKSLSNWMFQLLISSRFCWWIRYTSPSSSWLVDINALKDTKIVHSGPFFPLLMLSIIFLLFLSNWSVYWSFRWMFPVCQICT